MRRFVPFILAALVMALTIYVAIHAASVPPVRLRYVAGGFNAPLGLVSAHDGSGRLFVIDKLGTIHIIHPDGTVQPEPFLDITDRINSQVERGLLGAAFSPDYANDGRFYLNYTDTKGDTIIAAYRVSEDDPNRADPDSEKVLIWVDQPAANHNGGQIVFGPDGYLWTGLGDGGGGQSNDLNSQDPTNLLGALIRIDVNNLNEDDDLAYDIPPDNPFTSDPAIRDELWALGLRNPWRFSFDRETGDLYVSDVGEQTYEELNYLPAPLDGGHNFGWNVMEGMHCNALIYESDAACDPAGLSLPVLEYTHEAGRLAITGGYVYRGSAVPALYGRYLFADYGSGEIWTTSAQDGWQQTLLIDTNLFIDSFGEDEYGELYVVDLRTDAIYQIAPTTIWDRLNVFARTDYE